MPDTKTKIVQEMTFDKDTKNTRKFVNNDDSAAVPALYIRKNSAQTKRVRLTIEYLDD